MLNGIRIVEVEGLGPGPFAAMLLADLGADVICVHRKGGTVTPGMPEHSILDRGKRSIELDLKNSADIETFKSLVATADGLIEGFRPGVMEKLGLGPDICQTANPALVFGRMTGWGQNSALSHTAGHDLNYISLSGALWYGSAPGDVPLTPATLVGDIGGGAMYLAVGMLAAILKAKATGEGCVVDAAIYDGSAHMMNLLLTMRQTGNFGVTRGQNLLDGPHWSRTYRCCDGGFISVQCLEPKFYAQFLHLMGLANDADFQHQFDRSIWPTLCDRLIGMFASQPRDHWAELFDGSDACVAPVLNPEEAMAHPMNSRATWVEAQGALQAAPAPRFSSQPDWVAPASPTRGQHTDEIIAELDQRNS
ncbi:CaiB/BaiF CoA transferase family protein [Parasedimentitalea maritima]|uniref:CoA transferase n=1 Tax=Parasedimentitalea maritima TaxID=2578117 RepID=A0A6A4RKV1_9RHOB|nr:CaiB/BaiF CoA-transferase family protein [Zongyanglinia marina]KAE9632595.1 CoA transferase [Zongyanglinia marina]